MNRPHGSVCFLYAGFVQRLDFHHFTEILNLQTAVTYKVADFYVLMLQEATWTWALQAASRDPAMRKRYGREALLGEDGLLGG